MKKILWIIFIGMLFTTNVKSQCVEPNLLAWFQTKNMQWVDISQDILTMDNMDNCGNFSPYIGNKMYSVNFNPALLFDNSNSESLTSFIIKDNRSTNITIIGVLIPHDRTSNSPQWGLRLPYLGEVRLLDKDYMDIITPMLPKTNFPYGPPVYGQNLLNSDDDKFGKIVTYQTILRPDKTLSASHIISEIISLYYNNKNKGHVPEFMVYDGLLDEKSRLNVETYLAIKYGISKELDYLSCDYDIVWDSEAGKEYNQRKAGISNDAGWNLNQSRSTSYYDDDVFGDDNLSSGRFDDYDAVQDYSHHRNRLLTIGIEDESSDIDTRWSKSSFQVWGSNDSNLSSKEAENLITLNRIWRMETHHFGGKDVIPNIQWCNFLNMKVVDGAFMKKYASSDLIGIAASSLGLETCKKGAFTFRTFGYSGNGSIVGFSSDNMEFVKDNNSLNPNPTNPDEYKGYIYAIKFEGADASVVWDEDGDGYYDHEVGIGFTGTYKLTFERSNEGNYIFKVNGGAVFNSKHACHGKGGVYAKMHIKSNYFGVQVLNTKGFVEGQQKGTNVEFSYERIKNEVFKGKDMIELGLVPVLLIDRGATGEFDVGSAERIRGDYSLTPLGYGDKIEFVDVKWSNGTSDLFTLAFVPKCEKQKDVDIFVDECCDILNVSFKAVSCTNSEPIFYQLFDTKGNIILYGCDYTDEKVELGVLHEGDYKLVVYFKDCSVITKTFTLELQMSLPDNLIEEEVATLDNGQVLLEINTDFFPPGFDFSNENIEIIWTTPSGEEFSFPSPEGLTFLATETGTYTVEFRLNCDEETSCSVFDSVLVIEPCEYEVETSTSQCCYCNYLNVIISSEDCPEGSWTGAEISIYDENDDLICSMELTEMETEVPLCNITGEIHYEIIFADGSTFTGDEILDEFLWQEIDLIEQEECDTVIAHYDISKKLILLGGGWTTPIWTRIEPQPNKVKGYGDTINIDEPGVYTVEINKRCSGGITTCDNEATSDNGCQIVDTFCVVVTQTEDPCDDIKIVIGCDNSKKGSGSYGNSDKGILVCIYNVPPKFCTPTKWIITDAYGNFVTSGSETDFYLYNGVWYTAIPGNLHPGEYTFTVFFSGEGCPCGKKSKDFTISKGRKGKSKFVQNSYCIKEDNQITIDTILDNEDDVCVRWEKLQQDSTISIVKEGLYTSCNTYEISSEGHYTVQMYNCLNNETIDENDFTVLDCSRPLENRLDVSEIVCSDLDRRLELQIKGTDTLENYFDYQIWTLYNNVPDYLVYLGRIYKDFPTYVLYLPAGQYWMKVTNEYGYESDMYITISDYHRLPAEILYRKEYELQNGEVSVDASVNVLYDALYEWSHNGMEVSNEPLLNASDTGVYKVFVVTSDCQKTDSIFVTGQIIEQRSDKKIGGIKIIYQDPGFSEGLQKIKIINQDVQTFFKFEIFSISGQLIYSEKFQNLKTKTVNIDLLPGVYILRANNSQGYNKVEKLVVQ